MRKHKLKKSDHLYKRYCSVSNRVTYLVEQMSAAMYLSVAPEVGEGALEDEKKVVEDGIRQIRQRKFLRQVGKYRWNLNG